MTGRTAPTHRSSPSQRGGARRAVVQPPDHSTCGGGRLPEVWPCAPGAAPPAPRPRAAASSQLSRKSLRRRAHPQELRPEPHGPQPEARALARAPAGRARGPRRPGPADPPPAPRAPRAPPACASFPRTRSAPAPAPRAQGGRPRPPPPRPGMAASGAPAPREAPRRTPAEPSYLRTAPSAGAARGHGAGRPGGRAGPGAAATAVPSAPLFPVQEEPGRAEPGNQEVPRSDTSCRCYGNGPRPPPRGGPPGTPPPSRRPRPPASRTATAAAAGCGRCGRGRRHLGAPLPSRTCAPAARASPPHARPRRARPPAARAPPQRPPPPLHARPRRPRGRACGAVGGGRGSPRPGPARAGLEALPNNDKLKRARAGQLRGWLGPWPRSPEGRLRARMRPAATLPVFHFWLTSYQLAARPPAVYLCLSFLTRTVHRSSAWLTGLSPAASECLVLS